MHRYISKVILHLCFLVLRCQIGLGHESVVTCFVPSHLEWGTPRYAESASWTSTFGYITVTQLHNFDSPHWIWNEAITM